MHIIGTHMCVVIKLTVIENVNNRTIKYQRPNTQFYFRLIGEIGRKMSIFCRLCAETKDPTEIVTSITDSSKLMEQKLIACCQWNPQNTDLELPQDVCERCFYNLEKSWTFLQAVHKAQRKIQNLFGKQLNVMHL